MRGLISMLALGLAGCLAVGCRSSGPGLPDLTWTVLNVNEGDSTGQAHLLQIGGHTNILIVSGDAFRGPRLTGCLAAEQIRHLTTVLITDSRALNAGNVAALVDAGVRIDVVQAVTADTVGLTNAVQSECARRLIPFRPLEPGRRWEWTPGVVLAVQSVYGGLAATTDEASAVTEEAGAVLALDHGPTRVLFAGDISRRLAAVLAAKSNAPPSAVQLLALTASHGDGGALATVLEAMQLQAIVVSAPRTLWHTTTAPALRALGNDVPLLATATDGDITITFNPTPGDGEPYTIYASGPGAGEEP